MTDKVLNSDATLKGHGLIDPSCLFDPALLSPNQQRGFHLLFPGWHESTIFDRKTVGEMIKMLKDIDLTVITPKSVLIADVALTPSSDSPSAEYDWDTLQTFSRVDVDSDDASSSSTMGSSSSDEKCERAFRSRHHGKVTLQEIIGAVNYLKGIIVSEQTLAFKFHLFNCGLLATRLADLEFVFEDNEQSVLERYIGDVRRANSQAKVVTAMNDILSTIGFQQNKQFFACASFTHLSYFANKTAIDEYIDGLHDQNGFSAWTNWTDHDIRLVQTWRKGNVVQPIALCNLIANAFFGKVMAYTLDQEIDLTRTIAETIAFSIYGQAKQYNVKFPERLVTLHELKEKGYSVQLDQSFAVMGEMIYMPKLSRSNMCVMMRLCQKTGQGSPCPINDMLRIAVGLLGTPESFRLAVELGFTDYDDYIEFQTILLYVFRDMGSFDEITSDSGYEYAMLSRKFYSWHQRIKHDFIRSLTRDAFAVLVTVAALVVSFTGIIQVVQGFKK
ncbi:hypothetical protein BC940DRAFT_369858 [Gongronella butleri]|nr:hypothetical protein BC940DRAFT_369858 [Gongronella butleri]